LEGIGEEIAGDSKEFFAFLLPRKGSLKNLQSVHRDNDNAPLMSQSWEDVKKGYGSLSSHQKKKAKRQDDNCLRCSHRGEKEKMGSALASIQTGKRASSYGSVIEPPLVEGLSMEERGNVIFEELSNVGRVKDKKRDLRREGVNCGRSPWRRETRTSYNLFLGFARWEEEERRKIFDTESSVGYIQLRGRKAETSDYQPMIGVGTPCFPRIGRVRRLF